MMGHCDADDILISYRPHGPRPQPIGLSILRLTRSWNSILLAFTTLIHCSHLLGLFSLSYSILSCLLT